MTSNESCKIVSGRTDYEYDQKYSMLDGVTIELWKKSLILMQTWGVNMEPLHVALID